MPAITGDNSVTVTIAPVRIRELRDVCPMRQPEVDQEQLHDQRRAAGRNDV
jgi:hypothetical protein